MYITASTLQMSSRHQSLVTQETEERLKAWTGPAPSSSASSPSSASAQGAAATATDPVRLSDTGRNRAASTQMDGLNDDSTEDPRIKLIRTLIEYMLGRKIHVLSLDDFRAPSESSPGQVSTNAPSAPGTPTSTPPDQANYGIEYDYRQTTTEQEDTQFKAQGTVTTADGQNIAFDLNLTMSREWSSTTSVSLRAGNAIKKDPLSLNFDGQGVRLQDQAFSFDLDADGKQDSIHFVANGAFLALDRNGDGKINDGKELFGPQSGNGFSELAKFDTDQNGWIDENDPVFQQLRLWTKNADGSDRLESLQARNVGAINLNSVATPFSLRNSNNEDLGDIRSSSIFLQEDGKIGTIQQVDLTA